MITELVEGTTRRLTFTLEQPEGTAFDGTGMTVSALDIVGADNAPVDTTGDFGWVTASAGTVYYDPDAADFNAAKSPYRVRYQITDGSGKVQWFPSGAPDTIKVYARGV